MSASQFLVGGYRLCESEASVLKLINSSARRFNASINMSVRCDFLAVAICAAKNIYLSCIGWIVLDVAVILGAVMTGNTAYRRRHFRSAAAQE
jgi:hypothetical protein